MAKSRTVNLAALGGVVLFIGACSTAPRAPATMDQPRTGALESSIHDTLTQHNDVARGGAYLNETRLDPATVAGGRFERLFDWKVDGQIYAQPLYVSGLPTPQGRINVVIVATTNNSVYAFQAPSADSDVQPSKDPLWHVASDRLGAPLPYDFFVIDWGVLGHNIKPLIGITSTPVIDRQRGVVYVTVKTGYSAIWGLFGWTAYRLFALDLVSGDVLAGVNITADFEGPDGHTTTFDAKHHLQRPGLLEANDRIYLAFGSHQDTLPYHGWLLAYDADTLEPLDAWCTTCGQMVGDDCDKSCQGGIWQAGAGPVSDADGDLYVMTGNGTFDGDQKGDRGTSFVKLDKDLNVMGSWTPAEYGCLNRIDADLGSAGPTYLAAQKVLIGGGKEGLLYALQPDALHGTHIEPGKPAKRDPCTDSSDQIPVPAGPGYWSIQASPTWKESGIMDFIRMLDGSVSTQGFHHVHGSPVQWTVRGQGRDRVLLYVSAERDVLRAYEFDKDRGFVGASMPGDPPKDTFHSRCRNSDTGMPGGFLTVSANGSDPGSGIVWAAMPRHDEDALNNTVPGVLRAYQAFPDGGSELKEIWNSDSGTHIAVTPGCDDPHPGGADPLGEFAKFAPPTVAEGKVYVSTFSHRLVVYGVEQPAVEARAGGQPMPYDATLHVLKVPTRVEPGDEFEVSISARNTGSRPWKVEDDVRLGSRTIPVDMAAPVEGPAALNVQREVPPGETTTFDFHLKAGTVEETRDLSWRLVRMGGEPKPKQPSGEWFGAPTAESTLGTLRSACADLREQAKGLHQRARAVRARLQSDATGEARKEEEQLKGDLAALKQQAVSRGCSLRAGIDWAMNRHQPTPQ